MKKKAAKRVKKAAPKKAARTTTKPARIKAKSKSSPKKTSKSKSGAAGLSTALRSGRDDSGITKARAGKGKSHISPPALEKLAAVPAATDEGIRSLPPRQRMFVAKYLANKGNATEAAKEAGYSAKTAESQASRLLRNVKVKAAIDAELEPTFKRLDVTKDYVLEAIVLMIEHGKKQPVTYKGVPIPDLYKSDPFVVLKGAELLGKHLKMFTDKVEHSGKVTLEALIVGADEVVPA